LNMMGCNQLTITVAGLRHLRGIRELNMYNCNPDLIKAARELGLPVSF
jgi:hypothetical protein